MWVYQGDRRGALDVVVEGADLVLVLVEQVERGRVAKVLELDHHLDGEFMLQRSGLVLRVQGRGGVEGAGYRV